MFTAVALPSLIHGFPITQVFHLGNHKFTQQHTAHLTNGA